MFCRTLRIISIKAGRLSTSNILKRTFLSPAFQCEDIWNKRLDTPLLKKCVLDDFFYEIETKFSNSETINPIDVDIFVNAVKDSAHLDEIQELVHKLRLSRDSCDTLESTHHGLVRIFLKCKKYDDLLAILNDRLNYGIFPDNYCNILMSDTFLKAKDFKNAAKVACLQMLQEDFTSPLSRFLSYYSCHQFLLNPTEWDKVAPPTEPEDDEEVKVRVAYLRNPFFDDHFDLTEPNHLIGKTLIMLGQEDSQVSQSYQILGSILYNKLSTAVSLMKNVIDNKHTVHGDIFELIEKSLKSMTEKLDKESSEAPIIDVLLKYCHEMISNKLVSENQALSIVEEEIKQIVKNSEVDMIKLQGQIYEKWVDTRNKLLKETLAQIKKEERLAQVKSVKEQLFIDEQQLFFFDKEDQLDLEIEKKEEQARLEAMVDDKNVAKSKVSSTDYVPPEFIKQRRKI